jgi:hypothetical protein
MSPSNQPPHAPADLYLQERQKAAGLVQQAYSNWTALPTH